MNKHQRYLFSAFVFATIFALINIVVLFYHLNIFSWVGLISAIFIMVGLHNDVINIWKHRNG